MTVEYKAKAVQFGKLMILERKTNNEHLSLFINQLSDSVVDSAPEPLGFGYGSGIIASDPDLTFLIRNLYNFYKYFLKWSNSAYINIS
jgi:hypothetical protein